MSLLDCTPCNYFLKAIDKKVAAQSGVNLNRSSGAWGIYTSGLLNLITLGLDDR